MRSRAGLAILTTVSVFALGSNALAAPVKVAVTGDIQVQFSYSKAFFENSLVFVQGRDGVSNAPLASSVVSSAGLGGCPYEQQQLGGAGTSQPTQAATATSISGCIFDQGTCSSPPNTNTSVTCPFNAALFSYTCSCPSMSAQPFVTVGTIHSLPASGSVNLEFKLFVDPSDRTTTSTRVSPIVYDSDPSLPAPDNVVFAGETPGSLDHLHVTTVSPDLFILQWEDQENGGDNDYNDYIAVVRIVPTTCTASNASSACFAGQYTGIGNVRLLSHVKVDDAPTTGSANPGVGFDSTFVSFDTSPHEVAVCHNLRVDFSSQGLGAVEPVQQYMQYPTNRGVPACASTQDINAAPTISFSKAYLTTPITTPGTPNFDLNGTTPGGVCDRTFTDYTSAPTPLEAPNHDERFQIHASATGLEAETTTIHYPGPAASVFCDTSAASCPLSTATDVVGYTDWDQTVQTANRINTGTKKSEQQVRTAIYNVANNLPLTTYVYDEANFTPGTPTLGKFFCPSGVDVELSPSLATDQILPSAVTLTGNDCTSSANCTAPATCNTTIGKCQISGGRKLQGVPDVVAINSPVRVTIGTVPAGLEASSVSAVMTLFYTDNLPDLDPTRGHLTGIMSVTTGEGSSAQPFEPNQPFLAGGTGISKVHVELDFPENSSGSSLPNGFRAQLVAMLRDANTKDVLILSTIPLSHDTSPPTISAASTVRTNSGVTGYATVADTVSGIGNGHLYEGVNGAPRSTASMSLINGNYYDATQLGGSFSSLQPLDVVTLDLDADDTHFNTTSRVRLPVANNGGGDRNVECTSPAGAQYLLDGSRSTGPTDVNVSYLWSGPFGVATGVSVTEFLPNGPNTVSLSLTDGRGYTGTQTSTLTVGDSTPPSLTATANPSCIWPPNNKGVKFTLGQQIQYTVSDTCDPNPTVRILSVTASDGSTVAFDGTQLCAAATKGVTYTITLQATDHSGNSSTATTTVVVPHDQSSTQTCADPNSAPSC